MFFNYFKVAWRNLWRNKMFSTINVFGLALGLSCCMLLVAYIYHELSYDRHWNGKQNIYLLESDFFRESTGILKAATSSAPFAPALKEAFPQVKQTTRLFSNPGSDKILFHYTNKQQQKIASYQSKGYYVDSTFFDVFEYNFVEGNATSALAATNAIVLSENLARELFGGAPALGKFIEVESDMGKFNLEVTGVYDEGKNLSHINARFIMPLTMGWVADFIRSNDVEFAANNMFYTYIRLKDGYTQNDLEKLLPGFMETYAKKDLELMGIDKKINLVPVDQIHFSVDISDYILSPTTSKLYLYIIASIAIFMLLIACINFMNLSTARAAKRAQEVGVRKSLGASKSLLIRQYLGESLFIAIISFIIAIFLAVLFLPLFNQLTERQLNYSVFLNPWMITISILLTLLTGFIAGSYPAFYLSRYNPVEVLKGKVTRGSSAVLLRKGLVIFQFCIAICLVIATLVIQFQMRFLNDSPLGFDKENQVVIPLRTPELREHYTVYKDRLLNDPRIVSAGATDYYPGVPNFSDFGLFRPGQSIDKAVVTKNTGVDFDYLPTLNVQLKEGRLFSKEYANDSIRGIIMNEAAAKALGFKPGENVAGATIVNEWHGKRTDLEVVGLVKNFHFSSLHEEIRPYVFMLSSYQNDFNYLLVRTKKGDVKDVLNMMEGKWKEIFPESPFVYSMLDSDFKSNYQADRQAANIVNTFTAIAIFISCIGLFGLVAFSTQQRTKEIGIRKVLGASVTQIVSLLSYDFLKLVVIAILLACPLAWWMMSKWLGAFAYSISVEWWMLAGAAVLALLIAIFTVGFQGIKAALVNPVTTIKSE